MCETRKEKEEKPETGDEKSWEQDQKDHNYYYDDAHGYEIYQTDDEDDEDAEKKT